MGKRRLPLLLSLIALGAVSISVLGAPPFSGQDPINRAGGPRLGNLSVTEAAPIAKPSSAALMGLGGLALVFIGLRRRKGL